MVSPVVCVPCAQPVPNCRERRRLQSEVARHTLQGVVSRSVPLCWYGFLLFFQASTQILSHCYGEKSGEGLVRFITWCLPMMTCNLNDRAKRHTRARRGVNVNECTGAGLCTLVLYLYMLVCRLYRSVISSTDERSERRYDQFRLLCGNQHWVEMCWLSRLWEIAAASWLPTRWVLIVWSCSDGLFWADGAVTVGADLDCHTPTTNNLVPR